MSKPEPITFTDPELTAIYKEANKEADGKLQPIRTSRIFTAMRAMVGKTMHALDQLNKVNAKDILVNHITKTIYSERNVEALGKARDIHVEAITKYGLESKAAITDEIEHRDKLIQDLTVRLNYELTRKDEILKFEDFTPHTCAGFHGAFLSKYGRLPTVQEVWVGAIRSYKDLYEKQTESKTQ